MLKTDISEASLDDLRRALHSSQSEWREKDVRIVVVFDRESRCFKCMLDSLPIPKVLAGRAGCKVRIVSAVRAQPNAKNTSWVQDRSRFSSAEEDAEVEEWLLQDAQGCITEGTTSNLLLVDRDGQTWSTPLDRILVGTILDTVMHAVPVQFKEIKLDDLVQAANDGGAVAICSTSRLVLPVCKVMYAGSKSVDIDSDKNSALLALIECVKRRLLSPPPAL